MRTLHLLGIFIFSSSGLLAEDPLLLASKGKLLYKETFEEMTERLQVGQGKWQIVDGKSIKGMQQKEDGHTAFRKMFLDHQDVVYQFDFMLEGTAYAKFMINYELVHLANCIIKPDRFSISKLKESSKRKQMAAQAEKEGKPVEQGNWQRNNILLAHEKVTIKPGQWHTITIELVGDQMAAHLGDVVLRGRHPGLRERKSNFGIQAAGLNEWVHFDNLRIWKAE